jgi:hypothetical protein
LRMSRAILRGGMALNIRRRNQVEKATQKQS